MRQKVAARKACWYYFLQNSNRAVPIMPFYGHRRVFSDKPLVIVRSLASISISLNSNRIQQRTPAL